MNRIDSGTIRKVLVRSTNWIGDAVMTTPALRAVRAHFPNAELVVAANPVVAELFSAHPDCDRVLVFDKKAAHRGIGGLLRFSLALRKERFDLALLFQNAIEAALIARIGSIPLRAGYATDGRGFLLTHSVPVGETERRLHHTAYYRHMLKGLGFPADREALRLTCTQEEQAWAVRTLSPSKPWIAVNPGAAYGSAKRWFPDRFAAVADGLSREFDAAILLTGGPGESQIGREIETSMETRPLNLIGKTSVRQMMALLSRCRLMVTNDSGPMHVAAALGVPIVALFGPTDHTTTSPYAAACRIVRKPMACAPCLKRRCPTDHRCMDAIAVSDVLEAAREVIRIDR